MSPKIKYLYRDYCRGYFKELYSEDRYPTLRVHLENYAGEEMYTDLKPIRPTDISRYLIYTVKT